MNRFRVYTSTLAIPRKVGGVGWYIKELQQWVNGHWQTIETKKITFIKEK